MKNPENPIEEGQTIIRVIGVDGNPQRKYLKQPFHKLTSALPEHSYAFTLTHNIGEAFQFGNPEMAKTIRVAVEAALTTTPAYYGSVVAELLLSVDGNLILIEG